MPIYEFQCEECELEFERVLSFADYAAPQSCPECQGACKKLVSSCDFVLKGDDWPGKAIRVKDQMKKKNARLDRKMKDHHAPPLGKLVPNVNGEQVDTWSDAKKLAASKGKDTDSFAPLVEKEKRGQL